MPPRTAFAFGFAVGLLAVYFIGLVHGLSLGTLLWRSGLGALGFGAFCALLVLLLGDPLEIPPEEETNDEEEEEGEASGDSEDAPEVRASDEEPTTSSG
ncbi:MAG TPA: hypothetical protein VKA48_00405 [Gammaproteobacteria bacterium]|nr:hypothetical protein [Gammaproteobacteria bacterium]